MITIGGDGYSYDNIDKFRSKIWRNADGQIVIWVNGSVYYCKDGKIHRDGRLPAVIYDDGRTEYWVNGVKQK